MKAFIQIWFLNFLVLLIGNHAVSTQKTKQKLFFQPGMYERLNFKSIHLLDFLGISLVDYEQSYKRMYFSAFLFNMEFPTYTQYLNEIGLLDQLDIKGILDLIINGMILYRDFYFYRFFLHKLYVN